MARPREGEPSYKAIPHLPTDHLGGMTIPDQQRASRGAAAAGQFHQETPQVQVQRALQGQDLAALQLAFASHPPLLAGAPVPAKHLRDSEFFQKHRQEIAASLREPDPFNKDMPASHERQALAAKLEGLSPQGDERAPAQRLPQGQEVARRAPQRDAFGHS